MLHYVREDELTERQIEAGLASGMLIEWLRDGDGWQWYEQLAASTRHHFGSIKAVPPDGQIAGEADDDSDEFDDE